MPSRRGPRHSRGYVLGNSGMPRTPAEVEVLKRGQFHFQPDRVLPVIPDLRSVYAMRSMLKSLPYHPRVLGHIAAMVVNAVEARTRFRTFDLLKVLRSQVVAAGRSPIPSGPMRDLFKIYKCLILTAREDIQWCLSRLIKDRILLDSEVEWLIGNWQKSEHIANRLLLYPLVTPGIAAWARNRYERRELQERQSEILALLLAHNRAAKFPGEDPVTIAWAVWRSSLRPADKVERLSSLVQVLPADSVVALSVRLNEPRLIEEALDGHSRSV